MLCIRAPLGYIKNTRSFSKGCSCGALQKLERGSAGARYLLRVVQLAAVLYLFNILYVRVSGRACVCVSACLRARVMMMMLMMMPFARTWHKSVVDVWSFERNSSSSNLPCKQRLRDRAVSFDGVTLRWQPPLSLL